MSQSSPEIVEVLSELVACNDAYRGSNGDQAAAYYSMIKGKDKLWERARAALRASQPATPSGWHGMYTDLLKRVEAGEFAAQPRQEPVGWRWRWGEADFWKMTDDQALVPKSAPIKELLYTDVAQPSRDPDSPVGWGGHLPGKIEP